tara:strand:+ start:880 stop:1089 length:210 start_codon:yes stop_codon:yes gene_type:complete
MDELMDLLVKDESPNQISDKIKDILFAKTADKVTGARPNIMNSIFDGDQPEGQQSVEPEVEISSDEEEN